MYQSLFEEEVMVGVSDVLLRMVEVKVLAWDVKFTDLNSRAKTEYISFSVGEWHVSFLC